MRKLLVLAALATCLVAQAAQQPVNIGTGANTGNGDPLRTAFTKLNANDAELYGKFPSNWLTGTCTTAVPLRGDGSCGTIPGSAITGLTTHGVVVGEGTSGLSSVAVMAADTLLQGQGSSSDPAAVNLLNCGDSTHALAYSTSTHSFSCQAISGLSTPVTVPNGGTGLATLPAHGVLLGEGTSSVGNVAAMAIDTVLQGKGASVDPASVAIPNCSGGVSALNYSTSTHTFTCNSISAGATPAGATGDAQFNNGSGGLGANANFNWDNTNNVLFLSGPDGAGGIIAGQSHAGGMSIFGGAVGATQDGDSAAFQFGAGDGSNGGGITAFAGNAVNGFGGSVSFAGGNGAGTNQPGGSVVFSAGTDTGTGNGSHVDFYTEAIERMSITLDGGVVLFDSSGVPVTGGSKGPGTLNASGLYINGTAVGSGSVSSVALTTPSWLTVTGSPVTTTGTLAITAATGQTANRFLATPDGTTGIVGLRSIVIADLPTVNVAHGGTGLTTLTSHGILLGEGTSNIGSVAAMAADTLLQGQGASADPAAVSLTNCTGATNALQYATSTHTFGCQSIGGGGATFTQVFKTGNTSRTTTSPTADPDLVFTNVAAGNHTIRCNIIWTNAAATANIRYGIATQGTTTAGNYAGINTTIGGGGGFGVVSLPVGADSGAYSNATANIQTANTISDINLSGSFITTSTGDVRFGWGQLSSDPSNATIVKAGSMCEIS